MAKHVHLKFGQKLEVVQYLQSLEPGQSDADNTAAAATATLGFEVTRSHVRNIAKEIGFELARKTPPRKLESSSSRHAILAKAILDISGKLELLLRDDLQRDVERIAKISSGDDSLTDEPTE